MSLGHIFVFLFAFVSVVRLCISFTRSFCFGLFVSHLVPGADFLFGTKYFLFCMFGFVQDTSYCVCCPGPLGSGAGFRFGTNLLYIRSGTVRLREPGFCLNQVFGVCGPGPFSSGSRVLFKTKYLVYAVRDRSALEPAFVSERIVLYTVRDRSAPGAGFCLKPRI